MVTRDAAAIQALIGTIRMSNASTMMGLREVLREAGEALSKQHDAPLSISSLCELFVRFVTRTALASAEVDFDAMRKLLLERGEMLARTTLEARSKIARNGAPFIDAGGVILTQGYSRVVVALLLEAAKTRHFSVMVAESHPEGEGHSTAEALASASVPVTMIEHAAVAYAMSRCQMVLVGAEAVLESGGVISKTGTYQMAIVAAACKKPLYVAAESTKFARLFPLSQNDLPCHEYRREHAAFVGRGPPPDTIVAEKPSRDYTVRELGSLTRERLARPHCQPESSTCRAPLASEGACVRSNPVLAAAVVHHHALHRPRRAHAERRERRADQALRLSGRHTRLPRVCRRRQCVRETRTSVFASVTKVVPRVIFYSSCGASWSRHSLPSVVGHFLVPFARTHTLPSAAAAMSSDPLMLPNLEKVAGQELKNLQKRCMVLMQQDDEPQKFPGAQPVSFERKHLMPASAPGGGYVSLLSSPYFAAEKTDGVRYMLLILGSTGAFTVDRNFDMRRLPPMRFPSRADPNVPLDNTLLDGELIIERGGTGQPLSNLCSIGAGIPGSAGGGTGGGAAAGDASAAADVSDAAGGAAPSGGAEPARVEQLRFLAYDACRVAGRAVCDEPLRLRLMAMRREVLTPRFQLSLAEPAAFANDIFTLEQKDMFVLPQLPHLFSKVSQAPPDSNILYAFEDPLRRLSHGNDGIIFTPAIDPYRPYTCPSLLKWKPANMNSVDFRLQTKWRREGDKPTAQPRFVLCVAKQTSIEAFCWITFDPPTFERFANDPKADTRIIECVYDPSWETLEYNPDDQIERTWDNPRHVMGGWRFERIREDKLLPNDFSTVRSIQSSVRDGVTAPELLASLGIRSAPGGLGAFEVVEHGGVQHGAPPAPPPPPS